MQTLEFHISQFTPKTVMTARAMLEMAIEILAYQNINPDHQFASGPVLEIVRGCLHGFEKLSGTTPLRVKSQRNLSRPQRRIEPIRPPAHPGGFFYDGGAGLRSARVTPD
jgi:hypothetical protein